MGKKKKKEEEVCWLLSVMAKHINYIIFGAGREKGKERERESALSPIQVPGFIKGNVWMSVWEDC